MSRLMENNLFIKKYFWNNWHDKYDIPIVGTYKAGIMSTVTIIINS